jgi:hypothetical protein
MNKFWKWMKEKEYFHDGHSYSETLSDEEFFKIHYKMLIGFMLEYLIEKDDIHERGSIDKWYNDCKKAVEVISE